MSKNAEAAIGFGIALLIMGLLVLVFWYTNRPDTDLIGPTIDSVVTNDRGQQVVSIPYKELGAWVEKHNRARIISLASVNDGGYGSTTAFIVVYEVEVSVEE